MAAVHDDLAILAERLLTEQDVAAALDILDHIRGAARAHLEAAGVYASGSN